MGVGAPVLCNPGTYTDNTQSAACSACPEGRYCTTGSNPQPCPQGFYCPEGTGHDLQPCPAGTFSSATGIYDRNMTKRGVGGGEFG